MKDIHEMLLSREQVEKMYELLKENDKARYMWLQSKDNLTGIGPDVLIATVEDINTDILKEEDITDPGTW